MATTEGTLMARKRIFFAIFLTVSSLFVSSHSFIYSTATLYPFSSSPFFNRTSEHCKYNFYLSSKLICHYFEISAILCTCDSIISRCFSSDSKFIRSINTLCLLHECSSTELKTWSSASTFIDNENGDLVITSLHSPSTSLRSSPSLSRWLIIGKRSKIDLWNVRGFYLWLVGSL